MRKSIISAIATGIASTVVMIASFAVQAEISVDGFTDQSFKTIMMDFEALSVIRPVEISALLQNEPK
ncbi:hypothetical protein [Vibrio superstes]|uniref:Uncharacterized protein n=1 Tax=Vibrio superstes NBRC 103154 TaxID=1219062 RepID=A0A511QQX6_9VIBR|nr:hypothetical protein [Vibrio superstes]GEM79296.1 hypothetical protein VSU01S_15410 [Vibrio superstes NBRC 103154]